MPPRDAGDAVASLAQALGPWGARALCRLARDVCEAAAAGLSGTDEAGGEELPVLEVFGALVTLTASGRLRGCMGSLGGPYPLGEAVRRAARLAAVQDPRFSPLTAAEAEQVDLEISLMTPLEPVANAALPAAIVVGRDGLVAESAGRRGLLLPQVATEHAMDAAEFLRNTCRKAGLPDDAWRGEARILRFSALVIRERDPEGSIVRHP
jgi:AmmeMemoRadiSam system protein A